MEIKPIAIFRTRKKHAFEAARQASIDVSDEIGEIHFVSGQNFEQALEGIEGFSHLWLLYQFHQNPNWKPMVMPPRGRDEKIGVFATRSPHRPNALGISCVEFVERNGLVVKVKNFDLLDETPIFDIKPYVTYADSFPEAKMGWLESIEAEKHEVKFSPQARMQIEWLKEQGVQELENFLLQQLQYDPLNSKKKRLSQITDSAAVLAYRTWRAHFSFHERQIQVCEIFSGYSHDDLKNPADLYHDKEIHRRFLEEFKNFC